MSTVPTGRRAPAEVVFPPSGAVGYRLGKAVTTDEYADWAPIDEQMSFHERIRLLYVACTRARDHLVVSLTARPEPGPRTRQRAPTPNCWSTGWASSSPSCPNPEASGDQVAHRGWSATGSAAARSTSGEPSSTAASSARLDRRRWRRPR